MYGTHGTFQTIKLQLITTYSLAMRIVLSHPPLIQLFNLLSWFDGLYERILLPSLLSNITQFAKYPEALLVEPVKASNIFDREQLV